MGLVYPPCTWFFHPVCWHVPVPDMGPTKYSSGCDKRQRSFRILLLGGDNLKSPCLNETCFVSSSTQKAMQSGKTSECSNCRNSAKNKHAENQRTLFQTSFSANGSRNYLQGRQGSGPTACQRCSALRRLIERKMVIMSREGPIVPERRRST